MHSTCSVHYVAVPHTSWMPTVPICLGIFYFSVKFAACLYLRLAWMIEQVLLGYFYHWQFPSKKQLTTWCYAASWHTMYNCADVSLCVWQYGLAGSLGHFTYLNFSRNGRSDSSLKFRTRRWKLQSPAAFGITSTVGSYSTILHNKPIGCCYY